MKIFKKNTLVFTLMLAIFSALIYQGCVEKVDSEFDFQSDIIFVDAFILTELGTSSVTISKSTLVNEATFKVVNEVNASVIIENINTGAIVEFIEDSFGIYNCPSDFVASVGEEWKLHIELEDGRIIESKTQTVTSPVSIDNIQAEYSPEIEFNAEFGRLVPGHRLSIDWQDPIGEENFYLWKYKTFEPLFVCKTCDQGVLRNGECEPSGFNFGPPYFSYPCLPDCWEKRYGQELLVFHDQLENGAMITDREIAILPYLRNPNILVEVQQFSIDRSAYEYFKVINNQVSQSGGLNAPPPAALLGNLFNPNDASDLILGQFTAAGITTKRIFIDRSPIIESALTQMDAIILETCVSCPTSYPCIESSTRTPMKPDGWP